MVLMPLVGLVIGAILVLIQFFLTWVGSGTPPWITGAILTGAYIFLTGGLHFEGLADTCDGVFSGRTREQSLEIMKDSRIGVFGTLGIFMTGLLYFAVLIEIPPGLLLIFPLVGRACCLISASMAPYAREDGMGKAASKQGGTNAVVSAVVSMIGASFLTIPVLWLIGLLGPKFARWFLLTNAGVSYTLAVIPSLIAAGAAVLITILITIKFKRKLGGVTGDTFGAAIEVSSLVYLFVFIVGWRALLD